MITCQCQQIPAPGKSMTKYSWQLGKQHFLMRKRGKSLLWVSRLGSSESAAFAFKTPHAPFLLALQILTLAHTDAIPMLCSNHPFPTQLSGDRGPNPNTNPHTGSPHARWRTTPASPCRAEYPTWSSSCPHPGQASSRGLEQQSTNITLTRMHGWHLLLLFCREV